MGKDWYREEVDRGVRVITGALGRIYESWEKTGNRRSGVTAGQGVGSRGWGGGKAGEKNF